MNEDAVRDRSPRSPAVPLQKAIELVTKMHGECRRNAVDPETAVKALGFGSLHGAALSFLAGLREYGLIDRPSGKVALTALAVRIVHYTSETQRDESIKAAALSPKLFKTLLEDFGDCSQHVLESHLVQTGFNPERAKQVAKVFIANKAFAKLEAGGKFEESDEEVGKNRTETSGGAPSALAVTNPPNPPPSTLTPTPAGRAAGDSFPFTGEMLAQYQIPLGANQAHLAFTGEKLVPEDFDALIEYVELFKKQFERRLKSRPHVTNVPPPREVVDDFIAQHGSSPPSEDGEKSEYADD